MRRLAVRSFCAIVTLLELLMVATPLGGEEILQPPIIRIGEWWEFRNSRESWRVTVEAIDGDLYILSDSRDPNRMYYMDRNLRIVKRVDKSGLETQYAAPPYLKFPLDPNISWQVTTVSDRLGGEVVYSFTAKGWEEVDIGERAIRALRIDVAETIRRGGVAEPGATEVVWYSPEAKQIVLHVCDCNGRPEWVLVNWGGPEDSPFRRGR
ncbi:MAG: hypothetical protein HY613_09460 [Candidatus Rokubacteria bacterium]|nr:hypothetical protein [Candidatus Rokubacteria bacterium]